VKRISFSNAFAIALLNTLISFNASAQSTEPFISKSQALKNAGLSEDAVNENQKIVLAANANEEKFKSEISDLYAGTWIDHDSEGKAYQVLAVTDEIVVHKRYKEETNLKIVSAKYTLKQLNELKEKIIDKFFTLKDADGDVLIFSLDVDPRRNKIVLSTKSLNIKNIQLLFSVEKYNFDMIVFENQDAPERPSAKPSLPSGSPIVIANRGTPPSSNLFKGGCTSGFNAKLKGTSIGVVVTAGHCEIVDDTEAAYIDSGGFRNPRMGAYIGDFLANTYYKNNIDGVLFGNVNEAFNLIPGHAVGRTVKPVIPITNAMRGSSLCADGKISGRRCGLVESVNTAVNRNGRALRLTIASFCSEPGDSGGPVVYPTDRTASNGNAVGVVSGYIDNNNYGCYHNNSNRVKTTIQTLTPYLAIHPNVEILTN
jgi:hypothetical protein